MEATLSHIRTTKSHRITAACTAAAMFLAVVLVWPHAKSPAQVVPPFLPIFATWVTLTEGLTAFLLWTQYRISGRLFLATLAGAYAFVSVTTAIQLLVFPGVFSARGLLGAGPQSAIWIWVFWHGGFPTLVMIALAVRAAYRPAIDDSVARHRIGRAVIAGAIALSAVLCALSVYQGALLPSLISGTSYTQLSSNPVAVLVVALCVAALALHVSTTRLRTLMDLWLAIALLAGLADVALTLNASARYSVGWYAARVAAMFAASAVLGMLVYETSGLYRKLSAAHQALKESAAHDGLTGIFNRASFDERYPRAMAVAAASGQPLSLLLLDVDHFKRFNDTYGHQAGDECLRRVARALEACLRRQGDFVARYGGEEFVVVLPGCDRRAGLAMAETSRKAIDQLEMRGPSGDVQHVTISIGYASSMSGGTNDPAALVALADAALYRAKALGRNRVEEASASA
jgi:diguanylate cyclase (GGDEF)-like protein